jgi:hypothetical protein
VREKYRKEGKRERTEIMKGRKREERQAEVEKEE